MLIFRRGARSASAVGAAALRDCHRSAQVPEVDIRRRRGGCGRAGDRGRALRFLHAAMHEAAALRLTGLVLGCIEAKFCKKICV